MSVTRITKELFDLGLLVEDVHRTGSRGQPTRPLIIKADAAYAAGVYFSTRTLQIGVINLAGALIESRTVLLEATAPKTVALEANELVHDILRQSEIDESALVGVGFALPGDFTFDRNHLHAHALFPEFDGSNLQDVFETQLDFPVFFENDGASAALGERRMGLGQTISHFFFVHIGHGVGSGLVLNGDLYRGAHGNAGIIGVQFPDGQPRPSGADLLEWLRSRNVPVSDFNDLEGLRPQTCPPLRQWINRASDQLRHGLWITARILDPEAIIMGGRLPTHLLQEIVTHIDDETFCNEGVQLPRPKVFASSLGPAAGVIGAATIPLHNCYFSD